MTRRGEGRGVGRTGTKWPAMREKSKETGKWSKKHLMGQGATGGWAHTSVECENMRMSDYLLTSLTLYLYISFTAFNFLS